MSTLKVGTIQTEAGGAVALTKLTPAKAYVQFSDGDGTFDETFNATSETDNGNGDISYDFVTNMSNNDYPASGEAGGDFSSFFSRMISHAGSTNATARMRCSNNASFSTNQGFRMSSIIHGDLA
tara:strand:- start:166 stop:537 length:372 start_codon:yes stop_codon:yes gene_type:complete